ncbi:hypothetical protein MBLNU459_g7855t1 [Dothideomycetes sp. NU459]
MIALPVTPRDGEPAAQTLAHGPASVRSASAHLRSPRSPHSDHDRDRDRNSTPSISPLSTTSRANIDRDRLVPLSPTGQRKSLDAVHTAREAQPAHDDVAMQDGDDDDDDGNNTNNKNNDDDADDRSSSLSEFDGSFDEQDDQDELTGPAPLSPQRVDEADSEAETERLERTPQKPWKSADVGRTPSKLNQESTFDDDLSEAASSPEAPPSPTHNALGEPQVLAGRKRKRPSPASDGDSPLSEASDSEEVAKETRANGAAKRASEQRDGPIDEAAQDEGEEAIEAGSSRATPEPAESENPYISPMKAARLKRAKQRPKKHKEPVPKQGSVGDEEEAVDADEMLDDEDNAARTDEDRENRKRAMASFTTIAEQFQAFRAKLHAERLAAAEMELEQLNRNPPTHAEYHAMVYCISSRMETKIQQELKLREYKKRALEIQTLAERAQLATQFSQEARETRENIMYDLGKQWYDVHKDRRQRQADQLADKYVVKFPTKRSDQVRQQTKYNGEVSILAGVQRYVGMPAAPDINGARPSELDDDFAAMKIPRRQPQPVAHQHPNLFHNHVQVTHAPSSARTAEERFLEQTPWANPQHPYHQQSRTPAPFGPYTMHTQSANSPAVNLLRHESSQGHRTNSPFTPLHAQKRFDYHQTNGLGSSDTIGIPSDPPSSVVAAPPTTDRMYLGASRDDGSPVDSLKVRAATSNPVGNREDKRNFSGVSSASTIETPSDPAEQDRPQYQFAGIPPNSAYSVDLPGGPHHVYVTSALHAHNSKGEERKADMYDNASFRPQLGAFGNQMPLFAGASPARQDGQKAS